MTATKNEGNAF